MGRTGSAHTATLQAAQPRRQRCAAERRSTDSEHNTNRRLGAALGFLDGPRLPPESRLTFHELPDCEISRAGRIRDPTALVASAWERLYGTGGKDQRSDAKQQPSAARRVIRIHEKRMALSAYLPVFADVGSGPGGSRPTSPVSARI